VIFISLATSNGFSKGRKFPDGDAFLDAVQDILRGIETVTLDLVFLAWMERLERWMKTNGADVE
jgi:hypothetical protein